MLYNIVDFCHTSASISHRYTFVLSLLNLHPTSHPIPPLQVITEHWFELPESYGKCPLAIYFIYHDAYVPMLHSPFVPPSSSPPCLQLCSLCLHCCPARRLTSTIFLDSIYNMLIYDICFSLISLGVTGSMFVHLIRTNSNVFLF